ncbi:MAG: protein kinase, partial [Verrucomicrobia bacterium]|nr:protein kinase [Verrucomicrobiota bacterium]
MSIAPERELAIFTTARRLTANRRAGYLQESCAGDSQLRQRVHDLLQADETAGDFLQDLVSDREPSPAGAGTPAGRPTIRIDVAPSEKEGDRIGRYKILQALGEGGCGVVYLAEQEQPVRRRVALKLVKLGMDTRQVIARFAAEQQALALMDHPGIAKVLDAGATETGRPYFVMELV